MKKFLFLFFCQAAALAAAPQKVDLYLVGTGLIGSTLIDQIEKNRMVFQERYGIDLSVAGIANSRNMAFNPEGISLTDWRSKMNAPMDWEVFLGNLTHSHSQTIFVDCTSAQTIADSYSLILKADIPIVTPNKKANSGSLTTFEELKKSSHYYYDANVGAGLPILSTIQSLLRSGDEIVKIEGIFSGTLSFLFNSFEEGTAFSEIVRKAQEKGYTEPDPRDDLNGMDVLRKLLILAREAGFAIEKEEINLHRFLPDACFEVPTVEDFYSKLKEFDPTMSQLQMEAGSKGKRLRYIASFENGKGTISLQAIGPEHPFYSLSGSDNIVSITTKYYSKNPLVIRGPGAGADVTAARVLEGVVRASLEMNQ